MSRDPFSALPRLKGPALLDKSEATTGSALANLAAFKVNAPTEWQRILALGFDPGLSKEEVEAVSQIAVKPGAYADGFRLLPLQAHAYLALRETGCLFAPVGVGWGKTIIGLLSCAHYYEIGHRKILFLMEANGWEQLNNRDIPEAQQKLNLGRMLFHRLGMRGRQERETVVRSGSPGCYLMPYSLLSTKDSTDILYGVKPTVIIADEAHNLCGRGAARTKRLFSYVRESRCNFVPMSGTMTQKSIMDHHHLTVAAMGAKAPLPLNPSDAMEWAMVLDSGADPSMTGIHKLVPLMMWAQDQPEGHKYANAADLQTSYRRVRMSFQLRLRSAPGVVSTDPETDIGTSLVIANQPAKTDGVKGFEELQQLIKQVSEQYITPNGDDINHAIHTFSWLRQLSCGFWYRLDWPSGQDEAALEKSKIYHVADNAYNRALRYWLDDNARPHLDTPMLVGASIAKHGAEEVGHELWKLWKHRQGLEFPGRIERVQTQVRVCDYKIQQAVEWAKNAEHGIIWYEYQEVGDWLAEALRLAGVPNVLHCPAGRLHDAAIRESKGKMVVASIQAHHTTKNLQFHTNQFCFQFPRRAKVAEQMLGRVHRYGQLADEIIVHTNHTIDHDHMCFSAMLIDSLFVVQTQGNRRKVIFATYDPMPKMSPPEVLLERGFHDIRQLSAQGRAQLASLFGNPSKN